MLLCLGKKDFPVDVNVGRIAARLGWIPLDAEQALEVPSVYPFASVPGFLLQNILNLYLSGCSGLLTSYLCVPVHAAETSLSQALMPGNHALDCKCSCSLIAVA